MSGRGTNETVARLTENMVTSWTTKTIDDEMMTRILVLVSTTSGSRKQLSQQERAIAMLEALDIPFETLNGALPEYRQRRDALFDLSGIRGNYPQFFKIEAGETAFAGRYEDIETINENSNVPVKDLQDEDLTWDRLMGTTDKYDKRAKNIDIDLGADSAHSTGGGGGIYGELDDSDHSGGGNIYDDL